MKEWEEKRKMIRLKLNPKKVERKSLEDIQNNWFLLRVLDKVIFDCAVYKVSMLDEEYRCKLISIPELKAYDFSNKEEMIRVFKESLRFKERDGYIVLSPDELDVSITITYPEQIRSQI
ncbi:hypothetical protein K4A81_11070 [Bacillus velezensis]|uniref:hypothetical protein n=1 Tax=Bacillus velezensis TaxID=492670 RepID=UPI001CA38C0A|nr:hypothetical protein [Bacillus velezensis]QZY39786.1 hypothetical protein K4A81_11070 [Bacillus velezensis]WRT04723.1 hypothetical protein VO177_14125 [Bacillus velezensis]